MRKNIGLGADDEDGLVTVQIEGSAMISGSWAMEREKERSVLQFVVVHVGLGISEISQKQNSCKSKATL